MPKIRHLAIRTEDTGKLAKFYMDVFEMQILHKERDEGGVIYLTDGYFNLAILPNKEQNSPNGLYHFGFEVESGEKIVERLKLVERVYCFFLSPTSSTSRKPCSEISKKLPSISEQRVSA